MMVPTQRVVIQYSDIKKIRQLILKELKNWSSDNIYEKIKELIFKNLPEANEAEKLVLTGALYSWLRRENLNANS